MAKSVSDVSYYKILAVKLRVIFIEKKKRENASETIKHKRKR